MNKHLRNCFTVVMLIAVITSCQSATNEGKTVSSESKDSANKQNMKPVETGYADVNGLKMYYEVYGQGKPLVLLHGSYMTIPMNWSHIIPMVAKDRKVIVTELQGHGRTRDTQREISYEGMADDVSGLLNHLKIESADILGWSMGGGVAFQFAVRHPQQLRRLVVVSAPYKQDGWWAETVDSFATFEAEMFKGTPIQKQYDSLGNDPAHFAEFVKKVKSIDLKPYDWSKDVKAIKAPMVHSLKELAKNIREHARPGAGIITARIHTKNKFDQLKSGEHSLHSQYLEWFEKTIQKEIEAVWDIRVFDLGTKGLLCTLLESTETYASTFEKTHPFRKLLDEDVSALKDNLLLRHLFVQDDLGRLNQQSKRSIAHLGLLTLTNLIIKNNGIISAGSPGPANAYLKDILPTFVNADYPTPNFGTNYTILLPVVPKEPFVTLLPHHLQLPSDTTVEEIRGLEVLFDYEVISTKDVPAAKAATAKILTFLPEASELQNRDQENIFWQTFYDAIDPFTSSKKAIKNTIVHVDFTNMPDIHESNLFRFLGKWETYFPKFNLLLSNISTNTYLALVDVNAKFVQQSGFINYWNTESALVIYHFVSDENDRFYFSDVLWGETYEDFYKLNKAFQRNHFNSVALAQPEKIIKDFRVNVSSVNDLVIYKQNILLPFDVILKGPNDMTLFEHNAMMLLKNEMKAKSSIV